MNIKNFDTIINENVGVNRDIHLLKNKLIEGTIISIEHNLVSFDVSLKLNIKLPKKFVLKLSNYSDIKLGQKFPLFIEQDNKTNDLVIIFCQKARSLLYKKEFEKEFWNTITWRVADNKDITGRVLSKIKGGYSVGVAGLVGFLPRSQTIRSKYPLDKQNVLKTFSILKFDKDKNNLVISRKEAIIKWKNNLNYKLSRYSANYYENYYLLYLIYLKHLKLKVLQNLLSDVLYK